MKVSTAKRCWILASPGLSAAIYECVMAEKEE